MGTRQADNARRAAYSLAAGATAAAAGGEAQAQIVRSTPQDIAISQFASQTLNLDGDDFPDILLKNYVFLGGNYQGAYIYYAGAATVGFQAGPNNFAYSSALTLGDLIDPSTATIGRPETSLAYGDNNPNAEFNNVDDAYIGLAFPITDFSQEPAVTNIHHGWIRVVINNDAGVFVINDWAYNITPGGGIAAGQRADFNGDGVTDAADYVLWRNTLGTTRVGDEFIAADVDLSNVVDRADFDIWAEDYGLSAQPAPATAAVPEPVTLGLLAAGAAGLGVLRGARRREEPRR